MEASTRVVMALLLAGLTPLAGCMGTDGGGEVAPAAEGSGASETADATPSAAAPQVAQEGATAEGTNGTPTLTVTPVSATGSTGTGGCAYTLAGAFCQYPQASSGRLVELTGPGAPTRFAGAVTWTGTNPPSNELGVWLNVDTGEGWRRTNDDPYVTGSGGALAVDWGLSGYPPGAKFALFLSGRIYNGVGGVAIIGTEVNQDFTIEGELTTRGP